MLKVLRSPEQTLSGPVMVPGLARADSTATLRELGALGPQPLTARAVITPELVPEVTEILFVALEPTHPEGSVQV
jgi:hypothetical protein